MYSLSLSLSSHTHTPHHTLLRPVYGYGFLMVILVSACSLIGALIIPLLNKNNKFHSSYKYFYALMIALGTSALFCDAILHLIPEVQLLLVTVSNGPHTSLIPVLCVYVTVCTKECM